MIVGIRADKCDFFRSVERQYAVVFQQDEVFLRCFFRQCTVLRAEVVCFLFLGIRIFIWIFNFNLQELAITFCRDKYIYKKSPGCLSKKL